MARSVLASFSSRQQWLTAEAGIIALINDTRESLYSVVNEYELSRHATAARKQPNLDWNAALLMDDTFVIEPTDMRHILSSR